MLQRIRAQRRRRQGQARTVAVGLLCFTLLATACGTRVPTLSIIRAEGSGGSQGAASGSGDQGNGASAGGAGASDAGAVGGVVAGGSTGGGAATGGGTTGGSAGVAGTAGSNGSAGGGASGSAGGGGATGGGAISAGAQAAGCTKRGSPLIVGSVLAASGLIGQDVGSAKPILAMWSKYVNDHFGGVACHPVTVYSVDDGSDPGRSASAVNDLVVNKHAKALVGNFVPISISGFRSALDQVKVPAIGGDLFTLDWNQDPLMYPVGTVVDANAYGSMQSVAAAGRNKVAVLYCVEAPVCPAYKDAVVRNVAKAGASVVYNSSVSITQPDYTSVCQSAKNAGATQLAMIVDGAAVGRLARSCQSIGYVVPYAVASLGATFDRNDPNVRAMTVTVASAAVPWFRGDNAVEAEFQSALKTYAPTLPLDPTTIVAWASGMMLKAAIEKLGPAARTADITTDMIFQGLSKVQNETLGGLIAPQSYSPTRGPNPPNLCYFPAKFDGSGTWQAPNGTSYACMK